MSLKLLSLSQWRKRPWRWWLGFRHWLFRTLRVSAGYDDLPASVLRHNLKVVSAVAGGLLVIWVCQYYFEGRVNNSTLQWTRDACLRDLPVRLAASDSLGLRGTYGIAQALAAIPILEESNGFLPTVRADLLLQKLRTVEDSLRRNCAAETSGFAAATHELRRALAKGSSKARAEGYGSPFRFWLGSLCACMLYAALLLKTIMWRQRHAIDKVQDGEYYSICPIPLIIFASFLIFTFFSLTLVWARDPRSDVYWVWAAPYGAVFAAYAGSKDKPILLSQREWIRRTMRPGIDRADVQGCISWLNTIVDQDRAVAGWVLLVAFALGFTLMFGALNIQKERLTPEGTRALTVEYLILSAYIWSVGIGGIFFRYLKRVRVSRATEN